MSRLSDDLLAFSRLRRQGMNPEMINMEIIVKSVVEELTSHESFNKVKITIDPLPYVKVDSTLIKQVWINLISNAIKYTSQREIASIKISSVSDHKEVIFKIRDNGTGFDMQYADKLFGVFQRLHSDKEFEGTGLGLADVKRIINRHGGQVWAKGEINKGAEFYFTLPK